MAYQKAKELLELALELSASHMGVSLTEIDRRGSGQGASARRNTQRKLEALRDLFGDKLVELTDYDGRKRVRLERGHLRDLVELDAAELAALDRAIASLQGQNDTGAALQLDRLRTKVRLMAPAQKRRRIEVDYEALLAASSVITRPGPRPKIDPAIMGPITEAILSLHCLKFSYMREGAPVERTVYPYGVMMGHRVYLVAQIVNSNHKEPLVWRVDRMVSAAVTPEPAAIGDGFDLADFSHRAFGAFHNEGEYGDVVWKFTAKAAESARSFHFHPAQTLETNADGTLTVRFKASGYLEMAWFLYAWGDQVEVLSPPALKALVKGHQRNDFPGMP